MKCRLVGHPPHARAERDGGGGEEYRRSLSCLPAKLGGNLANANELGAFPPSAYPCWYGVTEENYSMAGRVLLSRWKWEVAEAFLPSHKQAAFFSLTLKDSVCSYG